MVAGAGNFGAIADWGAFGSGWQLGYCAFYLHLILACGFGLGTLYICFAYFF